MGAHTNFIVYIAKLLKPKVYLELGINIGSTFNIMKGHVPVCYGVEKRSERYRGRNIFNCTTDEFFKKHSNSIPPPDLIFIDADHKYEQVKKDFTNSLGILNKGGVIILHDTDPSDKKYLAKKECNDCYKIVDYIYYYFPELEVITLPVGHEGVSIVKREDERRVLKFV